MNPTGLGSAGGQAAEAVPSWRSYPDPAVARRSGHEEVSARVGQMALGTAELAGAAAPAPLVLWAPHILGSIPYRFKIPLVIIAIHPLVSGLYGFCKVKSKGPLGLPILEVLYT